MEPHKEFKLKTLTNQDKELTAKRYKALQEQRRRSKIRENKEN